MTCCCGVVAGTLTTIHRTVLNADTITDLVRNAGGNVDALFRASLSWSSWSDIDLHMNEPTGSHIFYSSKVSPTTGGKLDVDMNIGSTKFDRNTNTHSMPAVENLMYTDLARMPDGVYSISFVQFGVYQGRAGGADAPYLLLESRTENEQRMSHYVLLKWNGENQGKETKRQIPIANVRKSGSSFALESLGPDVTILQNHNFNLGPYSVNGSATGTTTENAATTGNNPTGA